MTRTLTLDLPTITVGTDKGLIAGTRILTLDGELPVEHLGAGDRIITRGNTIARLSGIDVRRAKVALVRFCADSLGHRRPEADCWLAPDTMVLIRDWRASALLGQPSALIPASRLADGGYVRREAAQMVTIFLPRFDTAHVIYAGGLEIGLS